MSDLITDAMVETATRANYDAMTWPGAWAELDSDLQESGGERAAMREALEAAAPLIAAKALRDAADALADWGSSISGGRGAASHVRRRAAAIEAALRGES